MRKSKKGNVGSREAGADKYRVQATISGRARFAFHRIQAEEGKDESGALELILTLLLERDQELVERYGLRLQDYRNARAAREGRSPLLQFEASKGSTWAEPAPVGRQPVAEGAEDTGNGTDDSKP